MKHRPDLVMTAYTGIIFCKNFSEFHKYAELLLSRPIFTHEFADEIIKEKLRELTEKEYKKVFPIYASAPQLLEACEITIPILEQKRDNLISTIQVRQAAKDFPYPEYLITRLSETDDALEIVSAAIAAAKPEVTG